MKFAPRRADMIAVIAAASLCGAAHAAQVLDSFGDWTLYRDAAGGKLCFLAAKPSGSVPAGANRDAPLLYVSSWTGTGVKAELSVRLGFPAKKGLEPLITVANRSNDPPSVYRMFVKDDRAFVTDATQELKLLDAMKKGSKLVVEATSERGTKITDTYTLNGITAGLVALAGACS